MFCSNAYDVTSERKLLKSFDFSHIIQGRVEIQGDLAQVKDLLIRSLNRWDFIC